MKHDLIIGKYTLESITNGMYASPLDFYREYIQNAVDSIDDAISDALESNEEYEIAINIDPQNRMISIFDNGKGISCTSAISTLIDIGNSSKQRSFNRGFRGIGRLAGLGYCDELVFSTTFQGEETKTIVHFNAKLLKQLLLVRHVTAQEETISRYIREGKIVPDMDVPISEHRTLHYFNKERVKEYCQKFGWTEITPSNRKQLFLDFCSEMQMSYSYKPVFLISFISNMNEKGEASLADVAETFACYYEDRARKGLPAEKKKCIFTKGDYTLKDVERLILSMPFKRFEGMGYMRHSKYLGIIQIDKSIMKTFDDDDISTILTYCTDALERYWG